MVSDGDAKVYVAVKETKLCFYWENGVCKSCRKVLRNKIQGTNNQGAIGDNGNHVWKE